MPSPAPPAGDSSTSRAINHQAGHKQFSGAPDDIPPATPHEGQDAPDGDLSPEEWLKRKQNGNEMAAAIRRLADREENAPFKDLAYSCINSILIEAARNPVRDRARVVKAMHDFGGGVVRHIAEEAKLPARDVAQILGQLVKEGVAYRSSEGGLYFLKDDRSAR